MDVQLFNSRKTIVFQGFGWALSFFKWDDLFSRGGGGVKMLISIDTYRTYNFPGGDPEPIPHVDLRMHSFF